MGKVEGTPTQSQNHTSNNATDAQNVMLLYEDDGNSRSTVNQPKPLNYSVFSSDNTSSLFAEKRTLTD